MSDEKLSKKVGLNGVKGGDVFGRVQVSMDAVKRLGESVDVYGNPAVKKSRLACEDMSTFRIEDCGVCVERDRCGEEAV